MAHFAEEGSTAVRKDATERSFRSLLQGLAVDLSIAVILVLATAVGTLEWTPTYWKVLGLTLAKTMVQAAVSYLMRFYVAPRRSTPV